MKGVDIVKKALSFVLAIIISISSVFTVAFASESSDGNFEFAVPSDNERIDRHGDFWYEFEDSLISDYFKVTRSSITITSITSTNTKAWFYIVLRKDGEEVGSLLCKDNGKEYSKTFNNLVVGGMYHLTISKFNFLVKGEGHITNISVN